VATNASPDPSLFSPLGSAVVANTARVPGPLRCGTSIEKPPVRSVTALKPVSPTLSCRIASAEPSGLLPVSLAKVRSDSRPPTPSMNTGL
jgi:hypothetical protein